MTVAAVLLAATGLKYGRVDAGGPELRMLITGNGGPAVVFEAGAGSPLESWVRVQPEVSTFCRTISYDRAGNGLSAKGPVPRDGQQVARELHTALRNAGVPPPYILVGHSLGGPYTRIFAGMFPQEVAGLVLVDPTQEELIEWAQARDPKPKGAPRPDDEVDCAPATFAQARENPVPVGMPVTLISGMGPREIPGFVPAKFKQEVKKDQDVFYPAKLKFHRQWLDKFPNGKLVVTKNSGHGIPFEEPDLIVNAIKELVEQTRRGK
jgi:pimeloyl-ACP methyl ester carboxylesterase